MAKQKRNKIIIAIAAVAILFGAYFLYDHMMYASTDNAQIEAHTVLLAAKVSGYLKEVPFDDGDKVKKGDVLVQIDDRDYKAAMEAAESEKLSLEARKNEAEKNYRRIKDLYAQQVVSQQQFDTATANYSESRARYDAVAAKFVQAQLSFEHTQIKAPSDGIIARSSAEVGQLASPGQPLIGFVSSEGRWVIANFKETEIEDIRKGNEVKITVDALSGKKYKGEVETISSATGATFSLLPPDNATGNFTKVVQRVPVKIKLQDLSQDDIDRLQAGLSVVVKVKVR
jgi:membrane fusion protein (multidrug efflux system)